MSALREVAVVTGVVAIVLLVAGTGGLGQATVDRDANVAVASDDDAYLGVETHDPTLEPGVEVTVSDPASPGVSPFGHDDVVLLTLRNQVGVELTQIEASISGDESGGPETAGSPSTPDSLARNEEGEVTVDVECPASVTDESETWTVTVEAAADIVTIRLSRQVTVTCEGVESGGDGVPTEAPPEAPTTPTAPTPPETPSSPSVGALTCSDLGLLPTDPDATKIEDVDTGTYEFPVGTVELSDVVRNAEGEPVRVDWSASFGVDAVIVKTGDGTTVHSYEEATSGDDLSGPGEKGISYVSFCYDGDGLV